MKKRLISVILVAAMVFTMTGCGGSDNTSSNAGTTAANKEATVEEIKDEKNVSNQTSLIADKEDKGIKSALITYDADKVRISDVVGNYNVTTTFDALEDDNSVLKVYCYESTVEELYEETYDGYRNMNITLTEMEDVQINGMTFKCYDALKDGEFYDAYYMLELDNGYILHNGNGYGYYGNIPLEEMLTMAFTKVESGDGTLIRAKRNFKTEAEGGVLNITFDSGESYSLDYAEDLIEVSTSGSVINVSVLDEETYDMQFSLYVSEKFDSIEDYLVFSEQDNFMDTEGIGSSFKTNIGGIEFTGIRENALGSNSVDGIFLAKLTDGYSLRGEYTQYADDEQDWWDEKSFYSFEDVLTMMFGGEGDVLVDNTSGEEEKETSQVQMLYNDGASNVEISYNSEVIHIDEYFITEPQYELEVIYDNRNGSYRYVFYTDNENYSSLDEFYEKNVTDCKKMFADAEVSEVEEIPCGNIIFYTFTMTYTDNSSNAVTAPLYYAEIEPGVYIYINLGDTIQNRGLDEEKLQADKQMLQELFMNVSMK